MEDGKGRKMNEQKSAVIQVLMGQKVARKKSALRKSGLENLTANLLSEKQY